MPPEESEWSSQYDALGAADPVLKELISQWGMHNPFSWLVDDEASHGRGLASNFDALVLHILRQQVSLASADAAYDRLSHAIGGEASPDAIAATTADHLRGAGLTRQKVSYLIDLAERQRSGLIDLENMDSLTDAEAVVVLTAVKGVGRWTAEVFLIAQLHRFDILPAADIGIRRAIRIAYGLQSMPTEADVRERGETWAPYRTFASEALWYSLPEVHGREISPLAPPRRP